MEFITLILQLADTSEFPFKKGPIISTKIDIFQNNITENFYKRVIT